MKSNDSQLFRTFLVVATLCLVVTIIVVGKPVLAPLALSCLLAFVLTPIVRYCEARMVPRGIAVGFTITLTVLVVIFLASAFIGQLGQMADEMPMHEREIESKVARVRELGDAVPDRVWKLVDPFFPAPSESAEELDDSVATAGAPAVRGEEQPQVVVVQQDSGPKWLEWVPSMIGPITEPIVTATIVVVLAAFMMLRRDDLRNRLLALLGRTRLSRMTQLIGDSSERLGRYLLGLLAVNFGFAVAFSVGLYFIGVPYAALWGCITFFFRFVPYLGTAISMLLPLVMAVATTPGWLAPLGVVAWYATLEFSSGNFLEPWLFGKSVGMNPLAVIIALMFWTWAWGMTGLLLATPLSLMLVTLGRHFPCFESLNLLLGDTHPLPRHIAFFQRILAHDDVELQSILTTTSRLRGPAFAVQRLLLYTLAHADHELRRGSITNEMHRQVITYTQDLTAQLVAIKEASSKRAAEARESKEEEAAVAGEEKLRVATFSMGDQRGAAVLQVLLSGRPEIEIVFDQEVVTRSLMRQCVTAGVEVVVLSITGTNARAVLESTCRALRRNGYDGWIAVGWWRSRPLREATKRTLKDAGADYVTYRAHAMNRMLDFTIENHRTQASPPGGDPPLITESPTLSTA